MLPASIKSYAKLIIENRKNSFVPWKSHIPVAGPLFDEKELEYATEAVMSCHWAWWKWNEQFEKDLEKYIGVKHVITTNSGSSANLLAFTALTAKELKDRRILPGDEIITVAAWFPTTINPIVMNGCVPVFVDVQLPYYEVDIEQVRQAITPKTKAIMIAHTLGNVFDLKIIREICDENKLWLIEDTCDALGAKYDGKYAGTYWDIATLSFYPAHHITMGEGGALMTNNNLLAKIITSYRDWWRDCWCAPGMDDTCHNRFGWSFEWLPDGFDHKYVYSHIWYNLKISDMQAALGVAQIEKLDQVIALRRKHWDYLHNRIKEEWLDQYFILPEAMPNSEPSWFGFLLSVREGKGFDRTDVMQYLVSKNIWTRLLFAGNYIRQPAFRNYVDNYRIVWDLKNTDFIMFNTFWVGVWPTLTTEMLEYVVESLRDFCLGKKGPILSVLVPAYNHPWYTQECLESIFSQKWFNESDIEVIMVDDMSPQDLSDLGQAYMKKHNNFYFERNSENKWMVWNWNYLLSLKKSKAYIFVSNDDRFYDEYALRKTYDGLIENWLDVCYGKYVSYNEEFDKYSSFVVHDRKWDGIHVFYDSFDNEIKGHSISFGWIMYRDYGYQYQSKANMWADWCMNLEYLFRGKKIWMLPEITFVYRDHPYQSIKVIDPDTLSQAYNFVYDRFHIEWEERLVLNEQKNNTVRSLRLIRFLKKYQLYKIFKVLNQFMG